MVIGFLLVQGYNHPVLVLLRVGGGSIFDYHMRELCMGRDLTPRYEACLRWVDQVCCNSGKPLG